MSVNVLARHEKANKFSADENRDEKDEYCRGFTNGDIAGNSVMICRTNSAGRHDSQNQGDKEQ